jgi:hypothetical protein
MTMAGLHGGWLCRDTDVVLSAHISQEPSASILNCQRWFSQDGFSHHQHSWLPLLLHRLFPITWATLHSLCIRKAALIVYSTGGPLMADPPRTSSLATTTPTNIYCFTTSPQTKSYTSQYSKNPRGSIQQYFKALLNIPRYTMHTIELCSGVRFAATASIVLGLTPNNQTRDRLAVAL